MEENVGDGGSDTVQAAEELKSDARSRKGAQDELQVADGHANVAGPSKQIAEANGTASANLMKEDPKVGRVLTTPKEKVPVPQAPPIQRWPPGMPAQKRLAGLSGEFHQRVASEPPTVHRPQAQVLPHAAAPPIRPQPTLVPIWAPQVMMGPHRGQLSMMPPPPPNQQGHQHSQHSLHMQQQKAAHAHLQQRPVQSVGGQHSQAAERAAAMQQMQQMMQRPAGAMHPPQNQSNSVHQAQQRQPRVVHAPGPLNMSQQPGARSHGPSHHHLQQMAAAGMLARGPPMFGGPGMAGGTQPMMSMANFHEMMALQPGLMRGAVMHGAFPMLPHMAAHMGQIPPGMTPMRFLARPNGQQVQGFWRPPFVPAQPPAPPVESTSGAKEKEKVPESMLIIAIGDRKVRLISEEDPTALYALCRRWLKNDLLRREEPSMPRRRTVPLPKPLTVSPVPPPIEPGDDGCQPMEEDPKPSTSDQVEQCPEENGAKSVEEMTTEELLDSHLQRFRSVKKRFKDVRAQRIARFKPRLAMLLPSSNPNNANSANKIDSPQAAEQLVSPPTTTPTNAPTIASA